MIASRVLLAIAVLALAACETVSTRVVELNPAQKYTPTKHVDVFLQKPDRPHAEIALIESRGQSEAEMLNDARDKAQQLGADAIVRTQTHTEYRPPYAVYDPWYDPWFWGYRYRPWSPFYPHPWGSYRVVGGYHTYLHDGSGDQVPGREVGRLSSAVSRALHSFPITSHARPGRLSTTAAHAASRSESESFGRRASGVSIGGHDRFAQCAGACAFVIVLFSVLTACSRPAPVTAVTSIKASSLAELQAHLLSRKPDLDLFRLRGPFHVKSLKDVDVKVGTNGLVSADLYLCDIADKAPLVILLHGYGNSKDDHIFQGLHLATWGMHAMAIDLPNQGAWIAHGKTLARLVEAIRRMPELGDKQIDPLKIVLVGHSFGATSVAAALGEGALVSGAVLLDPAGIGRQLPGLLKKVSAPVMLVGADEEIWPHAKPRLLLPLHSTRDRRDFDPRRRARRCAVPDRSSSASARRRPHRDGGGPDHLRERTHRERLQPRGNRHARLCLEQLRRSACERAVFQCEEEMIVPGNIAGRRISLRASVPCCARCRSRRFASRRQDRRRPRARTSIPRKRSRKASIAARARKCLAATLPAAGSINIANCSRRDQSRGR